MMKAVKGIYKNGQVQLLESPAGIAEGEVIVTFIENKTERETPRRITFGMFSNGSEQFTAADFREAEFQEDSDDGFNWT